MTQSPDENGPSPHRLRRGVLILTAVCAVTYFIGLTTHGLTNWQ